MSQRIASTLLHAFCHAEQQPEKMQWVQQVTAAMKQERTNHKESKYGSNERFSRFNIYRNYKVVGSLYIYNDQNIPFYVNSLIINIMT